MSKWRPPDWENIKAREWDRVTKPPFNTNLFEAGADAMLKSLRTYKDAAKCYPDGIRIRVPAEFKDWNGTLVFIPDDEKHPD